MMRIWLAAWLCAWAGVACAQSEPPVRADQSAFGPNSTRPLGFSDAEPAKRRFGKLDFIAGMEWTAPRADFGGFSGMLLDDDDTITVITDKGHWARAQLIFNPEGGLAAIKGLDFWRLYSASDAFLQRPFTDAEAITRDGDDVLIAFEGKHRVSRFGGLWGREEAVPGMPDLSALANNKGIEAMLRLPDGRLVLIAEEPPEGSDHAGWIIGNDGPKRFSLRRVGSYSPTDLALGPDGETLYLLERRYSLLGGPGMRIRRLAVADLTPGAMIEGTALIDIGAGHAVDNMEAIAARPGPDGKTDLFVLSDDNFSLRQRTLLLQFRTTDAD